MVESDLSVRHFNRDHHPCVTFDFSDARERQHLSSGHLYSTRVLRRAQRKKVGGGERRGKGKKKMKRSLYEVRFLKRRRHRFTSDIGSSSSVSCAIGSFDFCLIYLRDTYAHQPREVVSLKPYSRYITREERKNEKNGYFHDT